MKTKPTLLLLALPLSAAFAATKPETGATPAPQTASSTRVTPGSMLAAQIEAIIETKDLNEESRNRQIAAAIRLAMTSSLRNLTDPQQAAAVVLELAQAATAAAPRYADLIFRTVTTTARDIPVLAGLTGLAESVRAIVATTARAASGGSEAAGAEGERRGREREDHEFHGRDDDVIVSRAR